MESYGLVGLLGIINLKGQRVPERMTGALNTAAEYACDCGACDDGGYCICEDCDDTYLPESRRFSREGDN